MMTHTHITFCKNDLSCFTIAPHPAKKTWIETDLSHNTVVGQIWHINVLLSMREHLQETVYVFPSDATVFRHLHVTSCNPLKTSIDKQTFWYWNLCFLPARDCQCVFSYFWLLKILTIGFRPNPPFYKPNPWHPMSVPCKNNLSSAFQSNRFFQPYSPPSDRRCPEISPHHGCAGCRRLVGWAHMGNVEKTTMVLVSMFHGEITIFHGKYLWN